LLGGQPVSRDRADLGVLGGVDLLAPGGGALVRRSQVGQHPRRTGSQVTGAGLLEQQRAG
jgi:hypothetical protein